MPDSHAEQLDPSVLGEDIGDDRPVDDFPPEQPLAVDDPNIVAGGVIARDDVATRDARHVDPDREARDDGGSRETAEARPDGLLDPEPAQRDDEAQLVADEATTVDESPEARAIHEAPGDA